MRALTRLFQDFGVQGVVGTTPTGPPPPPLSSLGPHMGDWTRQPGNQVLGVPNGTYDFQNFNLLQSCHGPQQWTANTSYSVGTVITFSGTWYTCTTAHTSGSSFDASKFTSRSPTAPYGEWLILQAETEGGVIIDLADQGVGSSYRGGWTPSWDGRNNNFTHKDLRILFVGIKFINGEIFADWVNKIRFYRCTFSDEPHQWNTQYRNAFHAEHGFYPVSAPVTSGGTYYENPVPGLGNPHPASIRSSFTNQIEFHFCDFVDVGDDAEQCLIDNIVFRGCRWDSIYHWGVQYDVPAGTNGPGSAQTAFHSDAIQMLGGCHIVLRNCSMGGHLQVQGNPGSGTNTLDVDYLWYYGSYCMSLDATNFNIIGDIRHGVWFAQGQQGADYTDAPVYASSVDLLATVYSGASTSASGLHWHRDSDDAIIDINTWGSTYHTLPSGVTLVGGLLTDLAAYPSAPYPHTPLVFSHSSNPAVIDRNTSGHAATDWLAYFTTEWVDYFSAGTGVWP